MKSHPLVIVVVGATATGKSDFAQQLALEQNGEILNADSQQFYRGFDIGTGKIPPHERKVRHWLLDLCEPGERMTAQDFVQHAEKIIFQLHQSGKTPILVGGTGLYLKALFEGLDFLPSRDPEIRLSLKERFEREGGASLYEKLKEIDPLSAAKIHPHDPVRLIRYLEIFYLTGQAPSTLMKKKHPQGLRFPAKIYWLKPDREVLRARIAHRVQAMMAQGWLKEVGKLLDAGIDSRLLENKPIGYDDLAYVIEGKLPLEESLRQIIQKTQQYAKRQETYFRGLFKNPAYQSNGSSLKIISDCRFESSEKVLG